MTEQNKTQTTLTHSFLFKAPLVIERPSPTRQLTKGIRHSYANRIVRDGVKAQVGGPNNANRSRLLHWANTWYHDLCAAEPLWSSLLEGLPSWCWLSRPSQTTLAPHTREKHPVSSALSYSICVRFSTHVTFAHCANIAGRFGTGASQTGVP